MSDDFVDQPIVVGDTVSFQTTVEKGDGVIWDLTGAAVTILFQDPSGGTHGPFTATITDPTNGIASYQVSSALLNMVGDWTRQWNIQQTGLNFWSKEIMFSVLPHL